MNPDCSKNDKTWFSVINTDLVQRWYLWQWEILDPWSLGFPRQEYRSGLPFPPSGDLLNPEIKPMSPLPVSTNLESKNVPRELKSRLNIKLRDQEEFLQKNVNNIYKWKKERSHFQWEELLARTKTCKGYDWTLLTIPIIIGFYFN